MRTTAAIRDMVAEHSLHPSDLIYPVFVLPGKQQREPVMSMPGVERLSIDLLIPHLGDAFALGVRAVAIFPVTPPARKSLRAEEAFNPEGLAQTAIRAIKGQLPEMLVISDVALDPFTSHGQDGLVDTFGYSLADLEQFQLNAAEAAFQGLPEREELMDMIELGFQEAMGEN
jgi:porphobilinogen synthase